MVTIIAGPSEQARAWKGPAFLERGFRPFFLAAGLWAVLAVALWPAVFTGAVALPTAFAAVDWHLHEMLFGYGAAVVAGFLLTAIPNWTGRPPVAGWRLAGLAALWLAGRVAVLASAELGGIAAAVIDTGFLMCLAAAVGAEILASRNWRNLKVAVMVLVLAAANAGFHLEAAIAGRASYAGRAGLTILVLLILVIGGRVVPGFTQNWLARRGDHRRPAAFARPDAAVMLLSGLALASWVALPEAAATGALLLASGLGNLWRLGRWRGWATFADRLMLVLHLGFLLAALGFLAVGLHAVVPALLSAAAGVHVWAIGAIGTMTLAMMTRATLGHSGRALEASKGTQAVYAAVVVALLARFGMELWPLHAELLLWLAAAAWIAGFAGFVAIYWPMLVRAPTAGAGGR